MPTCTQSFLRYQLIFNIPSTRLTGLELCLTITGQLKKPYFWHYVLLIIVNKTRVEEMDGRFEIQKVRSSVVNIFKELIDGSSFFKQPQFWSCVDMRLPKVLKILSLQYLSNISRKRWGINVIFCMKIKIKVFYKLTPIFLVAIFRHPKVPETSLQYICNISGKKQEVNFMHADEHQSFLKLILSTDVGKVMPTVPKIPRL